MKSNYEMISSFCAIFVAVVALFVAIYQAKVTRDHQEISVWPYLDIYGTSVAKINDKDFPLAMYIRNEGIGPAMIKRFEITYKGKKHPHLGSVFKELFPEEPAYSSDKSAFKVILPGKEMLLIAAAVDQKKIELFHKQLRSGDIKIDTCYCSLYEACWVIGEDNENVAVPSCS